MEFLTKWIYRGWAWQATFGVLGLFWAQMSSCIPSRFLSPRSPFPLQFPNCSRSCGPSTFSPRSHQPVGCFPNFFSLQLKVHTPHLSSLSGLELAKRSAVRPAFFKCDTFAVYIRQRWFGQCAGTVCHILFMFLKFLHKSIQLLGWV